MVHITDKRVERASAPQCHAYRRIHTLPPYGTARYLERPPSPLHGDVQGTRPGRVIHPHAQARLRTLPFFPTPHCRKPFRRWRPSGVEDARHWLVDHRSAWCVPAKPRARESALRCVAVNGKKTEICFLILHVFVGVIREALITCCKYATGVQFFGSISCVVCSAANGKDENHTLILYIFVGMTTPIRVSKRDFIHVLMPAARPSR